MSIGVLTNLTLEANLVQDLLQRLNSNPSEAKSQVFDAILEKQKKEKEEFE